MLDKRDSWLMCNIIFRYILMEISFPFIASLFVFTFVLLMGKIIQLMDLTVNKGIGVFDIGKLIIFLMPSLFLFTLPIALLLSILIGLGRLSRDSEITVLRASGLSLYQLSIPIFIASIIAFFLTSVTAFFLVPGGNIATKELILSIARQKASAGIKEKIFNDDFKGLVFYADKIPVSGDYMEGVVLYDDRISSEPSTVIAKKGVLVSDPGSTEVILRLENGSIHTVNLNRNNYKKVDFRIYDIRLDLNTSLSKDGGMISKGIKDFPLRELADKIQMAENEPERRALIIELNERIAIPFSCFVFVILGIPLGIQHSRTEKLRGFTVGLILVVCYYILMLIGTNLGETGRISSVIGTWAANVIFGISGVILFFKTAREKSYNFNLFHHKL
jgi:lipopolysaccharide export system permease protein